MMLRCSYIAIVVGLFLLMSLVSSKVREVCETAELEKYHLDSACNRAFHNRFRTSYKRAAMEDKIKAEGPEKLPTQKTVICPNDDIDNDTSGSVAVAGEQEEDDDVSPGGLIGFNTVWLVENKASTPIVVAYVSEDGMEWSGHDASIRPPHRDERAILQPGQWKVFFTFEGHTFHVRSLLDGGKTLGPLLLKHRVGIIPIQNNYGPENILELCQKKSKKKKEPESKEDETKDDADTEDDEHEEEEEEEEEEKEEEKEKPEKKKKTWKQKDRRPAHERSPYVHDRNCNILDIGVRNDVGCPLRAYFAGTQAPNTTSGQASCKESFKFHLGLNNDAKDFVRDWDSKYEWLGTFVGHQFIFRLANNPSILVDTVSMQPTIVEDCPTRKKQTIVTRTAATPIDIVHRFSTRYNATNATETMHTGPPLLLNYTQKQSRRKTAKYFINPMGTFA